MITYLPRLLDAQLAARLTSAGAVLIEGPRGCGKTSTARQQAASEVRLDADPAARAAGLADPALLLAGPTPRLIDEWQLVPEVWNAVRASVDDRQRDGQFVLTGSATPAEELTRHSGALRIARLRQHPMSLFESQDSSGDLSLAAVLAGTNGSAADPGGGLEHVAGLLCRGGWPSSLHRSVEDAMTSARDYLLTVAGTEVVSLDGVRRDPRKVTSLLFSLARNCGTYVTNKTLMADSTAHGDSLTPKTLVSYLDALSRLWVVVEQPAWGEHLRSAAQVRRSPKRHLIDPSLATAALGATPGALLADTETFGQLFESLVFRDLTVYAQALGAEVRCYQDNHGAEIDAVVIKDGAWSGFEVKLSAQPASVAAAAAGLRRIATAMRQPPASLSVVVGTGPSYRRPDGVNVLNLRALRP